MIKDERYTGTMVSLKPTSLTVRGKRIIADQMELTEEIKENLIGKVKVYSDNGKAVPRYRILKNV